MSDSKKTFDDKLDHATSLAEQASGFDKTFDALASEALKRASSIDALKDFAFPKPFAMETVKPPKFATQEEVNSYQSASVLLRRLADSISQWRKELPETGDVQPAVIALLNGGLQIEVETLAQESFHGIRIEGKLNGAPCILLAHQSTIQLLCIIQQVKPPEHPRRSIGFIIDGVPSEA